MAEQIISGSGTQFPLKVNQDGSVNTNSALNIIQVQSGNSVYVARAEPGTSTGSPSWQMSRQTSSGLQVATTWASGNSDFDKPADDILDSPYS
jgi:hypothetical protein